MGGTIDGTQTNQTNQTTALPPEPPRTTPFMEPLSGQLIGRNGTQTVADWVKGLPQTDVGLSTLERWQDGIPPEAAAGQIYADLREQIAPAPKLGESLTLHAMSAPFNDVKVGYAMGQVAAGIEARIAANPQLATPQSTALAAQLRQQGDALSLGAASEATTNPYNFSFNGQCYGTADALAAAVQNERLNPSGTVVVALTPQMERAQAQAALDRQVWNEPAPLGTTWRQTAYFYARGHGATMEQQQQALAVGTGIDAAIGAAGARVAVGAMRTGAQIPGAQPNPLLGPRAVIAPPTQPVATPPGTYPVYLGRASALSAGLGQVQGTYTGMVSAGMPGPLPSNLSGTFAGGRYDVVRLTQDTVLYRAGVAGTPLGQYFSRTPPQGVLQTRVDKAVMPQWPNGDASPLDTAFAVRIPAGTEVYVGRIATQGGIYSGGTDQILVRQPWNIPGVRVEGQTPIQ